jgi:hypothetical protein
MGMSLLCALGTQKTRHQTPQSGTRMIRDIRTPEYLVVVCSDPSRYHVPFASVQYPTHTPCGNVPNCVYWFPAEQFYLDIRSTSWHCTEDFYHTLYKTPAHLLQSSTCTTCDNHTISSFTFNILILLFNSLRFVCRFVPFPPCFATFHTARTAKPHLLKSLKTQFICIYILFTPQDPSSVIRHL